MKHNKIKNVGVLFELLTRQITADTLNGVDNSPAIHIVKEFFKKDTHPLRELNLYKAVQMQKYKQQGRAEKFIDIVIKEHGKINKTRLRSEKYNLIKEVKSNYNIDDFFKSRVSNYRLNASIYTLLESKQSKTALNPTTLMKCRYYLVDHVLDLHNKSQVSSERIIKEYSKQDKDLRLLSYKILLEKFNNKYGKLSVKQRTLLREYINNISKTSTLKKYINEEIGTVNKVLNLLTNKVKNNVVKIKLQEVQQQLHIIIEDKKVRDNHLISLLRSYDLIRELRHVIK